jgi:hypothetical protein
MPGKTIRLGFELESAEPVDIPVRNMAVTGQTQESGKTTTLEALVARSGVTALAFLTKRGESAFSEGRRIRPYFRDRADWMFVDALISATMQEKNKFLRPWLIRICRNTQTLQEVQYEIRRALKKEKTGYKADIYTQLDAYLDLVVPDTQSADLAERLDLTPGLNVMDASGFSLPMQMLFIQSALDWVNEKEKGVVVVIPEAWEMVPEGKGSPVKAAATTLVRKGSAIGNHIWLDSQDMAGVDKVLLRGCPVWLIGVQREANEIKRNLSNIPAGITKPTPKDIALLERGQFYACWGKHAVRTYVWPAWLDESDAADVAAGGTIIGRPERKESEMAESRRIADLERENSKLRDEIAELRGYVDSLQGVPFPSSNAKAATSYRGQDAASNGNAGSTPAGDEDALYERIAQRLRKDPMLLSVMVAKPALEIAVTREIIRVDGRTLRGRIGRLIADGYWSSARTSADLQSELEKRGDRPSNVELGNEVKELCRLGFFTRDNKWIRLVDGMEVNVVER